MDFLRSVDWKLFLGLSRTPHGVLDLATPALGAMLALGHFPPTTVVIVGLITAFAGYTAVYALNDLVDYRVDQQRLALKTDKRAHFDVDQISITHPIAQGLLPFRSGLVWFLLWSAVALLGACWLNPLCALLFLASASLEVIYCKLLKITYLKVVPSALVKASGGLAGVLAVDPSPSLGLVVLLFLWLAAWEVGGQNVPNDIVDMPDDALVAARTTATVKGLRESVFILVSAAAMAAFGGVAIHWVSASGIGLLYVPGAVVLGWVLLLDPAREVFRNPGPRTCAVLFNRASYMPVAFLVLVVVSMYVPA